MWVTVPPGTSGGRKLRLRGKGAARSDGTRGDQFCRLRIIVPAISKDDTESRRLVEALMKRSQNGENRKDGQNGKEAGDVKPDKIRDWDES